jgi:hypothetical protein
MWALHSLPNCFTFLAITVNIMLGNWTAAPRTHSKYWDELSKGRKVSYNVISDHLFSLALKPSITHSILPAQEEIPHWLLSLSTLIITSAISCTLYSPLWHQKFPKLLSSCWVCVRVCPSSVCSQLTVTVIPYSSLNTNVPRSTLYTAVPQISSGCFTSCLPSGARQCPSICHLAVSTVDVWVKM